MKSTPEVVAIKTLKGAHNYYVHIIIVNNHIMVIIIKVIILYHTHRFL